MNENYIMLNGKRIDLTDEQVEAICPKSEKVEAVKKKPFERVEYGKKYFYIDDCGEVSNSFDYNLDGDKGAFECANYCTDRVLMEQRALHETLNRLLWRYSEEHGGDNEWDYNKVHYYIGKHMKDSGFDAVFVQMCKNYGVVYFRDKETAQSTIKEIVTPFMAQHPDFVW